jgi:type I restriction enzyme S subunit
MSQATQRPERLTDLIEIKHGFAFSSEFFGADGDYILLTPGNFAEAGGFRDLGSAQKRFSGPTPPSFILRKGDVLIAMTEQSPGLLGATIKVPESDVYLHNQRLGLLSVKNPARVCLNYLYHMFNAPHVRKEISASAAGTKVKHTSPTKLSAVEVFLPALADQARTAHLLDEWDTAIQKTEKLIAEKERHYSHELSRLISRGQHPHAHVGAFAEEVSARNRGGNEARVLSVTNSRGFVLPEDQFERRVASADLSNYKVVHRGQYAYNPSRINVGSIARLDGWDDGVLSPMYVVFRLDEKKANSDYFLHWLNSHEARQRIKNSAQGSVRETVSFSEFAAITIPIPVSNTQTAIARYLNAMRDEIDLLGQSVAALKTQKRGLMQKLLTGQWRLPVQEAVN